MHVRRKTGLTLAAMAAAALGLAGAPAGVAAASAATPGAAQSCTAPAKGHISCAAVTAGSRAVSKAALSAAATNPPGYAPSDLRSAYSLTSASATGGTGQTVAVVTAYDDATAEADLGSYRSQYSLSACTTANGCFAKVNQTGGTVYPSAGPAGWSLATAQNLDMISAICPNCHILLVEADSTGITDLGQAENEAVALGAKFVANTWFTPETTYGTSEPSYDTAYFSHPGVVITAPDGNGAGYGTSYPAASPDVIAVGGTSLVDSGGTWSETAWSGTGSGCSPYEPKPSWQTDTGCAGRMLNDAAAVADPTLSAVALYDTSSGGWVSGGGNDVAAAIVAAWFALGGSPSNGTPASFLYANTSLLTDITSGSDGTCTPAYFCTAGTGYDGPTGLGSPTGPFGSPGPADTSLPGGPVVHNTINNNMEVYGRAGTNVHEIFWKSASNAWSNWANKGGTVAGRPTAVYNPGSKNLEVYARGTGGGVDEDYWNSANGWSGWKSLGGSTAGNPAVVYNPADGNLEVYARGSGGDLREDYWVPGSGWSGWKSLGGSISGNPYAVWDPADGAMEIYAISTSKTLWEAYWRPKIGWRTQDLGGSIASSPSAVWNPVLKDLEVYASTSSGALWEDAWAPGAGWKSHNLGGSLTGTPVAISNPVNGDLEVYGQGTSHTLQQITWASGSGWSSWTSLASGVNSNPAVAYNPVNSQIQVYTINTSGALVEKYWQSGAGWKSANLGGSLNEL